MSLSFYNQLDQLVDEHEEDALFAHNDALYDLESLQTTPLFANRDKDIEHELRSSAKLKETIIWLQDQLEHVKTGMRNAEASKNHGQKGHLEGMRDGLTRCLKMLER